MNQKQQILYKLGVDIAMFIRIFVNSSPQSLARHGVTQCSPSSAAVINDDPGIDRPLIAVTLENSANLC